MNEKLWTFFSWYFKKNGLLEILITFECLFRVAITLKSVYLRWAMYCPYLHLITSMCPALLFRVFDASLCAYNLYTKSVKPKYLNEYVIGDVA